MGIRGSRTTGLRRAVGIGLVAVLAVLCAACSDDSGTTSSGDTKPDSSGTEASGPSTTLSAAELLGKPNAAAGEPVTIGLVGTGGGCAQCSEGGAIEEPTAKASIAWANDYLGGLGGHPIKLVVCNNELDPSKSVDCANQMIKDKADAVILGADSTVTGWQVLHDAGIPVVNQSTTQTAMLADADSTFVLQGSDAITVQFPIGAAKEVKAKRVSIIVIDTPAATDIYTKETLQKFKDAGLDVDIIPVVLGTLDMTPQAQQIVQKNPDGLVFIVGHDAFCIPAVQGLQAAGFTGSIATISYCVTDAMRKALPGDAVEGMLLSATDALGDPSDASTQQYNAVLDKYATSDIPRDSSSGVAIFSDVAALALGTAGLEGAVTPKSVIAAMRAMDSTVLPGTGGRHFRCNGKASPASPSVCMNSGLSATLDAKGVPKTYAVYNDDPIPD